MWSFVVLLLSCVCVYDLILFEQTSIWFCMRSFVLFLSYVCVSG